MSRWRPKVGGKTAGCITSEERRGSVSKEGSIVDNATAAKNQLNEDPDVSIRFATRKESVI